MACLRTIFRDASQIVGNNAEKNRKIIIYEYYTYFNQKYFKFLNEEQKNKH